MPEREQIAAGQAWLLMVGFETGSSLLIQTGSAARQDAWLAALLATLLTLAVVQVYLRLLRRHPGKTLVQLAPEALGNWLGKTVGLLYVWFALHLGAVVLRNAWEFLTVTVLSQTPPVVVAVVLAALVWWSTRAGLEVICRLAGLIVPVNLLSVILLTAALGSEMRLELLQPMLEHGPGPLLAGTFQLISFPLGETVLFAMILPALAHPGQQRPVARWAVVAGGLVAAVSAARNVATLGPLATRLAFPAYTALGSIRTGGFIEGLEGFGAVIWISATFLKIAVCLYAASLGAAQWLGLKDYRPMTGPVALAAGTLSFWLYGSFAEMLAFALETWTPYGLTVELAVPLLLLAGSALRHRLRSS